MIPSHVQVARLAEQLDKTETERDDAKSIIRAKENAGLDDDLSDSDDEEERKQPALKKVYPDTALFIL
jgi:hypothetical protein